MPRTSRQQSTLSFGSKSRVTKPTSQPKSKPSTPSIPEKPQPEHTSTPEPSQPHVAEVAVREQARSEIQQPWSMEDERAVKISEQDLKRYWKQEEEKRRAPRVHQEDLGLHEKILRHFDLSSQYGPCIGIARLKRWRRANMLQLQPPIEVLSVLLKDKSEGNQRAYVDELMS